MTLDHIPAGGLYRLEARFRDQDNPWGEWSTRGDMRHFLGVGDLWLIMGQSNSAGYGRGPVHDPPELGLHLFGNDMRWGLAAHPLNESTNTQHPVNREAANPGHSPHLHFVRLLKQHLGYPIGLVQTSRGGSSLAEWSHLTESPSGDLFRNLLRCAAAAGRRVRGCLWYQGETDANEQLGETYLERFAAAVAAWREHLGQPHLPILTVQLNRHLVPATQELGRHWSLVREAQRQAARTIPGVYVVPSLDLPLSDGIHTSPAGNMLLGERLARLALGTVNGRPMDHLAPDVQSAVADGRGLRLTFAPVVSRMDNVDPQANPFVVEDAQGHVPIQQVLYPGGAVVQLVIDRPTSGRAVVHGGFGQSPASVPLDIERFLPMLSFYDFPIT